MSEMKLHEAIRLGAMHTKQGYGSESIVSDIAPCALGAARLACGINAEDSLSAGVALKFRFPLLLSERVSPVSGEPRRLSVLIWTLNDQYKWTREQIADWVETIEDAQEAEARRAVAPEGAETETVASAVRLVPQKS